VLFKVIVNDAVEITRDLPWSKIVEIKEHLKRLGFKWTGDCWRGKVISPSTILKLKDLPESKEGRQRRDHA